MRKEQERERMETPEEELVADDDRIIGKAFRWSLAVIALLVGGVAMAVYLGSSDVPTEETRIIDAPTPQPLDQQDAAMPQVTFRDITREAGITFVHQNGARGEKLLPETMGAGAAFFDYDNDQDPDLLLIDGTRWSHDNTGVIGRPRLYRNDGDGKFVDMTEAAGLRDNHHGFGVAVADYDGDGLTDVFIAALGPNRLFRNLGEGRFKEVTQEAGVAGGDEQWSSSAGFFDYDGDGDLDLFVCNYVRWSRQIDLDLNFTLNGRDRAYGPPTSFTGTYSYLYRNEGGGRFTDVSAEAGIQVDNPATGEPMGKALALSPIDLDRDGWMDVLVANDTVQNFLFHNKGDGTFEEIGAFAGVGFDAHGAATGAMGIDTGHYRNDGSLGVGVANFSNEMTSLLVAQDDPLLFSDEAAGEGIGSPSRLNLSFGLFFFDYDLDGRLDLLQANGHLEEEINQIQASQHYLQPAQLFWNSGVDAKSCYLLVPPETTGDLATPIVGRGASFADIDADGDLDVLLTQTGRAPLLLRNDLEPTPQWVRLKLQGKPPNRNAIGAWITLDAGGMSQRRQVMPTRSYLSQVELAVTFGLGSTDRIDRLEIRWPDGTLQEITEMPPLRQTSVLVQR